MTFRTLMLLASMLLLAVGLVLSVTPVGFDLFYDGLPQLTRSADGATDQIWVGVSFMRLFGVTLACLGFVTWFARSIGNPEAQNAVARGMQYGAVIGFFVALAQEVTVLHSVAGGLLVTVFLALVAGIVHWRVHHAKADPYGVVSVRV